MELDPPPVELSVPMYMGASKSRRTSPNLFPVPSKQRIRFRAFGLSEAVDAVFAGEGLVEDNAIARDGEGEGLVGGGGWLELLNKARELR